MDFTLSFIQFFLRGVYLTIPLLLFFVVLIICLGLWAGRKEGWSVYDSLYWSFITALTVGYGDMRPLAASSKAISILIALAGIMFTGLIVAITVATAAQAFHAHAADNIQLSAHVPRGDEFRS